MSSIKAVCFDLNKTLIRKNTWYELNLAMGVTAEEDERFLQLYNERKMSYVEVQKQLELMYLQRGRASKNAILEVISKYSYNSGAKEIVTYLQEKGYEIILLSGSLDAQVEQVARELKIKYFASNNDILFNAEGYMQSLLCRGDDEEFKLKKLREFCDELGIEMKSCVCVGDGDNEFSIFKETEHGMTFKGSKLKDIAWKLIDTLGDIKNYL